MTHALDSGTGHVRRRALFGLLDADGWGWASVKATIWLIVIILMLGYIPDRAYYIVVNRTIDVGLLAWSPINFCPPDNNQGQLPCPAPQGAILPWQASPSELALPAPRAGGTVVQFGSKVLYVGGTDGSTPVDSVYVAALATDGNFSSWQAGPSLPAPRTGLSVAITGGHIYAFGGSDGHSATDSAWTLSVDPDTGELGAWEPAEGLSLPAARSGAAIITVSDGLVLVGGADASGAPTTTTWRSTVDTKGALGAWEEQAPIQAAVAGATVVQVGDYLWLIGGTDANGPSGAVQRGSIGTGIAPPAPGTYVNPNEPAAPQKVLQWAIADSQNLPAARAGAAVFAANGSIYVVGGQDGSGPQATLYWAIPDENGDIPEWKHLAGTDGAAGPVDLPEAISGAAALVNGPTAFVVGGVTSSGVLASSVRASLAPQEPFFQLGLVGATVPALKIDGELGQQLGMLSAAGAGTTNFVILLLLGWAWSHRPQIRAWVERRMEARRV
jgi:hypothetical protein